MPIRPIDIATIAPRSQEASISHAGHEHGQQLATEQLGQGFEQNIRHDSRKPVEAKKEEKPEYEREHSGGSAYQHNKGSKKEQKEEENKAPRSTSMFDITI